MPEPTSPSWCGRYTVRESLSASTDCYRTLLVSASGLENAKKLVSSYKQGEARSMTPEIWQAKKVVDSTLHPGKVIRGQFKQFFS